MMNIYTVYKLKRKICIAVVLLGCGGSLSMRGGDRIHVAAGVTTFTIAFARGLCTGTWSGSGVCESSIQNGVVAVGITAILFADCDNKDGIIGSIASKLDEKFAGLRLMKDISLSATGYLCGAYLRSKYQGSYVQHKMQKYNKKIALFVAACGVAGAVHTVAS